MLRETPRVPRENSAHGRAGNNETDAPRNEAVLSVSEQTTTAPRATPTLPRALPNPARREGYCVQPRLCTPRKRCKAHVHREPESTPSKAPTRSEARSESPTYLNNLPGLRNENEIGVGRQNLLQGPSLGLHAALVTQIRVK